MSELLADWPFAIYAGGALFGLIGGLVMLARDRALIREGERDRYDAWEGPEIAVAVLAVVLWPLALIAVVIWGLWEALVWAMQLRVRASRARREREAADRRARAELEAESRRMLVAMWRCAPAGSAEQRQLRVVLDGLGARADADHYVVPVRMLGGLRRPE